MPAGLSHSSSPSPAGAALTRSPGGSSSCCGELLAQEADELVPGHRGAETGGGPVAAAPLGAGDRGDVDPHVARASETLRSRCAVAGLGRLAGRGETIARERRHCGAAHGAQMVDHALR